MTSKVRVISAASADHFKSLRCMVHSLSVVEPSIPVRIFALEQYVSEREAILRSANARLTVRSVNWSTLPAFARINASLRAKRDESRRAGHYAWKPLLIAQSLADEDGQSAIIWFDSEHRLQQVGAIDALVSRARRAGGVYSPRSAGSVRLWTHPQMLAYLYNASVRHNTRGRAHLGPHVPPQLLSRQNCDASTLVFIRGAPVAEHVLALWSACASDLHCISPAGSSRHNHRQDQSALTLILHQLAVRERTVLCPPTLGARSRRSLRFPAPFRSTAAHLPLQLNALTPPAPSESKNGTAVG